MLAALHVPPAVRVAFILVACAIVVRFMRKQGRAPSRPFLLSMNARHFDVTTWGLSHITIGPGFTMLDIGCGGGRTIETLAAAAPGGKVFGVDYSEPSVTTSLETNARSVDEGRVDVRLASVSALPFEANTFDLVTGVETHYYWPELRSDVKEVLRVMKPGGQFVLIAETYRGRRMDWIYRPTMALLGANYLTVDEHHDLLESTGFANARVFEERKNGWICAVAEKPM